MKISIVTTLYRSASFVEEFYRRMIAVTERLTQDFEVIFVDDGSPDDALGKALDLQRRDNRVTVVELSRNFGHYKAMMTGLMQTTGELCFLIDVDLEEPPETLEVFYKKLEMEANIDVVFGVQARRKGGLLERISGDLFYKSCETLCNLPLPKNLVTARLMRRNYVDALLQHKEHEIFMAGLWSLTGFRQIPLVITKTNKGSTTYGLGRRIGVFFNAIVSFSSKPLIYVFYLGTLIVCLSLIAAGYLIVRWFFFQEFLMGWPSLIVSVWLLGGINIFCVGIVGYYVSKVFSETKQRPYSIIRKVHRA